MLKNILYISAASLFLMSCGPKEYSACDCQKIMSGEGQTAENKTWCENKIASDATYAEDVTKCVAESMGFDTSKVEVKSNTPTAPKTGTYTVDTSKSKVKWTGRKKLGSHLGEVQVKSGEFMIDADGLLQSGNVVIDMTSISVTDIEDEESNGDLVGHLKADDFFGTANFPEAVFTIKSSELMQGATKTNFKVEGDLTIKGITKPMSAILMLVQSKKVEGNVSIAGGLKFDRTEFDIKYNSGKFFDSLGDRLISDDVTLQITLVAS